MTTFASKLSGNRKHVSVSVFCFPSLEVLVLASQHDS